MTFLPLLSGESDAKNYAEGADTDAVVPAGQDFGGGRYPNADIANIALAQVGQNIGIECKPAVTQWVARASGYTQNVAGGYYIPYQREGGTLVGRDDATKGDIIQTYYPGNTAGYYSGMHTMVVVSHQPGSNTFDVVDSNSVAKNTVGHHLYDPYAKVAALKIQTGRQLAVAIWRMGEVDAPVAPPTSPPAPAPTPTPTPPASPAAHTVTEVPGTTAHTWTNYTNAGGSQGPSLPAGQGVEIACKLPGFKVADGNTWWYRIASSPWNGQYYVSADAFYNNGASSGSLSGTPYVDGAVPDCGSTAGGGGGGSTAVNETAGSVAHTWTNYTNAGGTQGPSVGNGQTVSIACRLTGFKVADGNTWWYRIASSPWSSQYYVSADAFYNNGSTSGPLKGTPFVDNAVPSC